MSKRANVNCRKCNETDIDKFGKRKVGNRVYPRHLCKKCHNRDRTERYLRELHDPVSQLGLKYRERKNLRNRLKRKKNTFYAILTDCRKSDKKRGFPSTDLTIETIKSLISDGCVYCGETTIRISLDRKDNSKGHLIENVVGACVRCNYFRRDMPFDCWLEVAKVMRVLRTNDAFKDWIPNCVKKVSNDVI